MKKVMLIPVLIMVSSIANANKIASFISAKNALYSKVFNNSGQTLYCECNWVDRKVDIGSCGLQSYFTKKQRKRSLRTEVDHIIPASWMLKVNNKKRQCAVDSKNVNDSAREYCQKHDLDYRDAHNDLVNLYPTVGQINADKSSKPFIDNVKAKIKAYDRCGVKIGSRGIVPLFF